MNSDEFRRENEETVQHLMLSQRLPARWKGDLENPGAEIEGWKADRPMVVQEFEEQGFPVYKPVLDEHGNPDGRLVSLLGLRYGNFPEAKHLVNVLWVQMTRDDPLWFLHLASGSSVSDVVMRASKYIAARSPKIRSRHVRVKNGRLRLLIQYPER
jgi:hypothetical protein